MKVGVGADARMDSGLSCLVLVLRLHGIPAELEQLRHQLGGGPVGVVEMLRLAKVLGLEARSHATSWRHLSRMPLPAVVEMSSGSFLILGKVSEDTALVHDPVSGRPSQLTHAEFEALWSGRIVLMARRAQLADLTRRFDINWFLQAMVKYRRSPKGARC